MDALGIKILIFIYILSEHPDSRFSSLSVPALLGRRCAANCVRASRPSVGRL